MRIGGEGPGGVGRVDNARGERMKMTKSERYEARGWNKSVDVFDFTCRARTIASRNTTEASANTVTDYPPESTGALDPLEHAIITSHPRCRPNHDPHVGRNPLPYPK